MFTVTVITQHIQIAESAPITIFTDDNSMDGELSSFVGKLSSLEYLNNGEFLFCKIEGWLLD